jgi:hypothetical protein
MDVGFDGQFGRAATHTSGIPNDMRPLRDAEIRAKAPTELFGESASAVATGRKFFIPFEVPSPGLRFSEAADDYIAKGHEIRLSREEVNGVAALRLAFGDPLKSETRYWLDPARGYAMLKFQQKEPDRITEERVVNSLVEAAPGVWFPTSAHVDLLRLDIDALRKDPTSSQRRMVRQQFRAAAVVVNDPQFDNAVFTVPIPEGYDVVDEVRGVTYTIAPVDKVLAERLDDIAASVSTGASLELAATRPSTAGALGAAPLGAAQPGGVSSSSGVGRTRMLILGLLGLLGFIVVLGFVVRYRRKLSSVPVIVAAALCVSGTGFAAEQEPGPTPVTAPAPAATEEPATRPGARAEEWEVQTNCGLNVAYVRLRLHGRDARLADVSDGL